MTKSPKSSLNSFPASRRSHSSWEGSKPILGIEPIAWTLGILFGLYALLTLNGYGNHDDIYRMIGTWRTLLSEHRYVPSRFQGYLIPELVIGVASHVGGFYLSNLVSAALSIASLFLFYRLLIKITSPLTACLATAAVGSNPFWIIPSVTSTDYIYPAFFFLLGVFFLVEQRLRWAGIVLAMAVSARLTYGPMGAIALAFYFPYLRHQSQTQPNLQKRYFQAWMLFLLGTMALYAPVFFASGMTLSFLGFASDTSGGTVGIIARFLYKNVYLWGLPAFILLSVFVIRERKTLWKHLGSHSFNPIQPNKLLVYAILAEFIYSEVLFARLPHQYQYLIPVLFCGIYFVTLTPQIKRRMLYLSLIVLLHGFYAICNIDVLDTYQTGATHHTIHSDGATVKLLVKEGVLVRDFHWRSIYQRNLTEEFNQRWQHFGAPLANPL